MSTKLAKVDLCAAGIKVGELAAVLGVHRTTLSDLLSGKTERPTPGAHAIVWMWPRLSGTEREALLAGEHFAAAPGQSIATRHRETSDVPGKI
jgi:hypothetical protein